MDAEDAEQEERCPTSAKSYNDLTRTLQAQSIDWLSSYSRNAPAGQSETMPVASDSPGIILFISRVPFLVRLSISHLPTHVSLRLISNLL